MWDMLAPGAARVCVSDDVCVSCRVGVEGLAELLSAPKGSEVEQGPVAPTPKCPGQLLSLRRSTSVHVWCSSQL